MKTFASTALALAFVLASVGPEAATRPTDQQVVASAGAATQAQPARDLSAKDLAPPTGTGVIAGAVIDLDKRPVRRALVTVEGTGEVRLERTTITDEDGRFSVASLPVGRFTISAEKIGYPQVSYGAKRPFRAGSGVFVQAGQKVTDISLTLAPGSGMTGVVYDEHGEPLPGVPVQAWEVRTSLNGERALDFPSAGVETLYTTDEQGRYRIYGLAPGEYLMGTSWFYSGRLSVFSARMLSDVDLRAAFQPQAPAPVGGTPSDSGRYNYAPAFSPGVTDPFSAGLIKLAAGEMRSGVDLRMVFEPVSSLDATISAPDGSELSPRMALGRRNIPDALKTGMISGAPGGRYRSSSLAPGDYSLMAQVPAAGGRPALWAIADFTAAAGQPVKLSLFLQPALTVTGSIRFESASAKPPADLNRVSVFLSNAAFTDLETAKTVEPTGALSITGIVPGQYTLRASVPAGISGGTSWAVKSVLAGGQDVTDRQFEVPSNSLSDFTITFTDVVTELSGTISSPAGGAATDYFVIAIPADRAYWLQGSRRIASARPDGSGRYQFRTLPPGEYRIALTTDLVAGDLRDTHALEGLLGASVAVTIGPGEKKTLDLRAGR